MNYDSLFLWVILENASVLGAFDEFSVPLNC